MMMKAGHKSGDNQMSAWSQLAFARAFCRMYSAYLIARVALLQFASILSRLCQLTSPQLASFMCIDNCIYINIGTAAVCGVKQGLGRPRVAHNLPANQPASQPAHKGDAAFAPPPPLTPFVEPFVAM